MNSSTSDLPSSPAEQPSWLIFAIDQVWIGVFNDETTGYQQPHDPTAHPQGPIFTVNRQLRPAPQAAEREALIWLQDSTGRCFGVPCDQVDEVIASPLVSLHSLPPILAASDPLLQALLLPDKRRVALLIDVDRLARELLDHAQERSDG